LKHAFTGSRKKGRGEISIGLHAREPGGLILTTGDNGVGVPKGLQINQTESLGLRLVCGLAEQLRGTIEHSSGPGTEFRLTVPA